MPNRCTRFLEVTAQALGPDALAAEGLDALAEAAAARRRTPIKVLLLDQSVLAGIGNIYASEALHLARVDPAQPARELTRRQVGRVVRGVTEVLEAAIEVYDVQRLPNGSGDAGRVWVVAEGVDGREGEPCRRRRCAGTIVRTVQAQRSTFHCPASDSSYSLVITSAVAFSNISCHSGASRHSVTS